MTASEQRLHPASILFDVARYARIFAWPALLAFFGSGRAADPWAERYGYDISETWLWILMVPSLALSLARYLSFRVRYEPDALVIRSGILFRNVRHLPYARIQNLDAVQNVFHRALGVVDVRIETGGGGEVEARLSVLPRAALEQMRERVFVGRGPAVRIPPSDASSRATAGPAPETSHAPLPVSTAEGADPSATSPRSQPAPVELLHLPLRELLLCGFLENKGMVLVGAAYGALWQAGAMDRIFGWWFAGEVDARGIFGELLAALLGARPLPTGRLMLALGGVAAFLVLVRLLSMAWAFVRLHDFRLTRRGDDLRITFGLFTRVTATIPRRRVQTLTVEQGWLHRRLCRASVRVETAGGSAGTSARDRQWVAPIVALEDVPRLVGEILPGATVEDTVWQSTHPRAFRRAVKPALAGALVLSTLAIVALGWRGMFLALLAVAWAGISARQHVRHLRWAATDRAVAFRSGWLTRRETRVRPNRIQVVTLHESPFDRRAAMARVRVDTAGGGERSHAIDIPYLANDVARALRQRLSTQAARTAFRW
ncbi:MAG: PH domain-containing protein [Acidobacteriota bacterium]|nr:PH domain-containing protein [Acidobacteriota bacterium]